MMSQSAFPAAAPRRHWLLFLPFALVVLLAAAWTGVWFYAAARAEAEIALWRERERQAGRAQDCASHSIGGYPFRIEVRCVGASFELRGTPTLQLKLPLAVVAVPVYDPKLLIGEFTGPLEISGPGGPPAGIVNWTSAQASVRGLPAGVQRASLALVEPTVRDGQIEITNARLVQEDAARPQAPLPTTRSSTPRCGSKRPSRTSSIHWPPSRSMPTSPPYCAV
jgi:hypothetical protein